MTMYAITATGYRAISSALDAQPSEVVVDEVPQSLIDSIAAAESQRTATAGTIRTRANDALVDLRAYRDLASPTNAQTVAAVKLLCRVAIALIRLNLAKLDGAD